MLFLASSIKVGFYLWKPETKEEKLEMISGISTSEITRKRGHLGWILGKTRRRKQEEKVGLLGDFSRNWQSKLPGKIGPEHKVGTVFWENFLLKSWRELKNLLIHIKWVHNEGHFLSQKPIGSCWTEAEFGQETLSALRQRRPFLSMFRTFSGFSYFWQNCR